MPGHIRTSSKDAHAVDKMPAFRVAVGAACLLGLLATGMSAHAQPLPNPATLLPETPIWSVRDDDMQSATDIELSPDGSTVYVASLSKVMLRGSLHGAPSVSAYDAATGERKWRFSSRNIVRGHQPKLAVSPDGVRIYLHSTIIHGPGPTSSSPDRDIATWALKAENGANLWYRRYDGPQKLWDSGRDVIAKDNLVVVTGTTYRKGGLGNELWLRGYGARNGAVRWTRIYSSGKRADPNGDEHAHEEGVALAFANGGRTAIVTGSTGKPSYSILTLAVASKTGAVRWIRRTTHPEHDDGSQVGMDIAVHAGRSFVAGLSDKEWGDESRPVTLAHRVRDGRKEWFRPYEPTERTYGSASSVVVHRASGAPIFAGQVSYLLENDAQVSPFRLWSLLPATGALRWESEDVGSGAAYAATMDPAGNIVYGTGSIENDAVVIAYDATDGSALWMGSLDEEVSSSAGVVRASAERVLIGGSAQVGGEHDMLLAAFGSP